MALQTTASQWDLLGGRLVQSTRFMDQDGLLG